MPAPIAAAIGSGIRCTLARTGALGRFANGPSFDLRGSIRYADEYPRARAKVARAVGLADEVLEHFLGDCKVGDYAVFQRTNRRDVARRPAQHVFGFVTDGFDHPAAPSGVLANGDDRRFVQDDTVAP